MKSSSFLSLSLSAGLGMIWAEVIRDDPPIADGLSHTAPILVGMFCIAGIVWIVERFARHMLED